MYMSNEFVCIAMHSVYITNNGIGVRVYHIALATGCYVCSFKYKLWSCLLATYLCYTNRYQTIVKYKTSYYTFCLPVRAAMYIVC